MNRALVHGFLGSFLEVPRPSKAKAGLAPLNWTHSRLHHSQRRWLIVRDPPPLLLRNSTRGFGAKQCSGELGGNSVESLGIQRGFLWHLKGIPGIWGGIPEFSGKS